MAGKASEGMVESAEVSSCGDHETVTLRRVTTTLLPDALPRISDALPQLMDRPRLLLSLMRGTQSPAVRASCIARFSSMSSENWLFSWFRNGY